LTPGFTDGSDDLIIAPKPVTYSANIFAFCVLPFLYSNFWNMTSWFPSEAPGQHHQAFNVHIRSVTVFCAGITIVGFIQQCCTFSMQS
jgi:hypothetical protein